ncbi:MFS transporter [Corynebacterium freiburgense]|uniref:MFS transporter n=1 Tax=Corynebacterium freiburgense TaxID=556548 RepID=UPI00146FAC01
MAIVYIPQAIFTTFADDFGISAVRARDTFTVSAISYALAFFVFGPLSDVFSARMLGSVGAFATAIFGTLSAISNSFVGLILSIAATGIAAASVPSAMFAMAGKTEPEKSGRYFGIILAATVAGITIGRSIGALITGEIGWRWAYGTFAIMILIAGFCSLGLPAVNHKNCNVIRAYSTAMGMVVRPAVLSFLTIGGALFVGYLGITTILTLRLSGPPMFLDSTAIGLVSLSGLIALVGAPFAGTLVPKIGPKKVSVIGLIVCVIGAILIVFASNVWVATAGLLILYLGVFAAQPALMVRLSGFIEPELKGSASAVYFLVCLLAGSFGGSLLGWLCHRQGWFFAAGIAAIAIFIALLIAFVKHDKSGVISAKVTI